VPTSGLVAVPTVWLVSVSVTFHEAAAADVGCLALEDALGGTPALLNPSACRRGERRVLLAFGLLAPSAGAATADARALLVAGLLDVRPIPLWIPASVTVAQAPELTPAQGSSS
jgi:hypothetical protein